MFVVGAKCRLTLKTSDLKTGVLGDPTTLTVSIKDPAGAVTVHGIADITKNAAGDFEFAFVGTIAGPWGWRWHGVGGVEGAAEGFVMFKASAFPNPLA